MNLAEDSDPSYRDPLLESLEPEFMVGAGRYTLRQKLGVDIFSVRWLAWDIQLNEEVSLKFFPSAYLSLDDTFNALRIGVQKSRKLSHPNILRIYEFHSAVGEPAFVTMEYFEGTGLATLRLDQPGQVFSWAELNPLIIQACDALEYAHSEGQAHGYISPRKMLLDQRGRLKLADFGFPIPPAELLAAISTTEHAPTILSWISPQALDRSAPEVVDDIYSFGASLYTLLTGTPPFVLGDIKHQIRNIRPQPLHDRLVDLGAENDIPPRIQELVLACLAKNPGERPPNFRVLAELLIPPQVASPTTAPSNPSFEPISLIPPKSPRANPIDGQKAVEALQAFQSFLPQTTDEDEDIAVESDDKSPRRTPLTLIATIIAVVLLGTVVGWILKQQPGISKGAIAAQSATPPAVATNSEPNLSLFDSPADSSMPQETSHGTYVGKGPGFSYHYAPRESLALDTNAANMGVKFGREGPQDSNCSYIMAEGKTNNSLGTITYQFRAAPGYLIEDMTLSQSAALYTSGRIRGVYSINGGKTFSDFYLTPPYNGKPFGFRRTATLYSLKAPTVLVRYIIHRYTGSDYNLQFLRDCDDGTETVEINGTVVRQNTKPAEHPPSSPPTSNE